MHVHRIAEPIYREASSSAEAAAATSPKRKHRTGVPRHTTDSNSIESSSIPRPFSALISSATSTATPASPALPISLLPFHRAFQPDAWRIAVNTPGEDRLSGKHIVTSLYKLLWLKSPESILGYDQSRHEIRKLRDLIRQRAVASLAGVNTRQLTQSLPQYTEESEFNLAHALYLPHTIVYTEDCSERNEREKIWLRDLEVVADASKATIEAHSSSAISIHPSAWYFSRSTSTSTSSSNIATTSQAEILRKNHSRSKQEHGEMLRSVFLKKKRKKEKTVEEVAREEKEMEKSRKVIRPTSAHPSTSPSTAKTTISSLPGKFVSICQAPAATKPRPTSASASRISSSSSSSSSALDIVAQFISLDPSHAPRITYLERKDMEVFVRNVMRESSSGNVVSSEATGTSSIKRARPSTASTLTPKQQQDRLRQEFYANLYNDMDILVATPSNHDSTVGISADARLAVPGTRLRKRRDSTMNTNSPSQLHTNKRPIGLLQEYTTPSPTSSFYHIQWQEEVRPEYLRKREEVERRKREVESVQEKMRRDGIEFSHELLLLQSVLATTQSTLDDVTERQSYCKITEVRNNSLTDDGELIATKKKPRYQVVYEKVCCTDYSNNTTSTSSSSSSSSSLLLSRLSLLRGILHTRFTYMLSLLTHHIRAASEDNLQPWKMSLYFTVDSGMQSEDRYDVKLRWCDQLVYWHEKEMMPGGQGPERSRFGSEIDCGDDTDDREERNPTKRQKEEKDEIRTSSNDPLDIINRDSSAPVVMTITSQTSRAIQLEHDNSNSDIEDTEIIEQIPLDVTTNIEAHGSIELSPSHQQSQTSNNDASTRSWAQQVYTELQQRREEEQKMYEEYGKNRDDDDEENEEKDDAEKRVVQNVEVVLQSARTKERLLSPTSARVTQRTNGHSSQQQPVSARTTQRSITSPSLTSRALSYRSQQQQEIQSMSLVPKATTLQQAIVKSSWELKSGENVAHKAAPQSRAFINSTLKSTSSTSTSTASKVHPYRMKQIELLAPPSEHTIASNAGKSARLRESPSSQQLETPLSNCSSLSALSATILTANKRGMSQSPSAILLGKQEEELTFLTSTPLSPRLLAARHSAPQLSLNNKSSTSASASTNSTYFTCPRCRLCQQITSVHSVSIGEIIEEYERMRKFVRENEVQIKQEVGMKNGRQVANHFGTSLDLSSFLPSSTITFTPTLPPTLLYIFPYLTSVQYHTHYKYDQEFKESRVDLCQDCVEVVVRNGRSSDGGGRMEEDDDESPTNANSPRITDTASSIVPYDLRSFNQSTISMLSSIAPSDVEREEMQKKYEREVRERKAKEEEVRRIRKKYAEKGRSNSDTGVSHPLSHIIGVASSTTSHSRRPASALTHSINPFMPARRIGGSIQSKLDEKTLPEASLRARENRRRMEREKRERELQQPSSLLSRYDPDLVSSLGGGLVTPAADAEFMQTQERRTEAEKAVSEIVRRSEWERISRKVDDAEQKETAIATSKPPSTTFAPRFAPLHSQLHPPHRPPPLAIDSVALAALEYQKSTAALLR